MPVKGWWRMWLGVLLLGGTPVSGFILLSFDPGASRVNFEWSQAEAGVPFIIHGAGSDDLAPEVVYQVIRHSFQLWEEVPTTRIRFVDQGLIDAVVPDEEDGVNLIYFDETGEFFFAPPGTGVIAVTHVVADGSGRLHDADIVFNGRDWRFVTGNRLARLAGAGEADLDATALHEAGHFLGLDHSPLAEHPETTPTMTPFQIPGTLALRSLEPDDIAGASFLYPAPGFIRATGTISGRVADRDDSLLVGAQVMAENLDTGALFSTLTGADVKARTKGDYILRALPPGPYRLRLSPTQFSPESFDIGDTYAEFARNFPEEFYDNIRQAALAQVVDVEAGRFVGRIDFTSGFSRPGFPLLEPVVVPNNTPDDRGPYIVRVKTEDAVAGTLVYCSSTGLDTVRLALEETAPNQYRAQIPGQPVGTGISYQIQVADAQGRTSFFPHPDTWARFEVVALSGAPLAFAALRGESALAVWDTGDRREVARVLMDQGPIQVLAGPQGQRLYVSNLDADEIAVVSTATFQVVDRIGVAAGPLDMALDPNGGTLYVTNSSAAQVTAIDLETHAARTIGLDGLDDGPYGVAAGEQWLYAADLVGNQVLAFDREGTVAARIPVTEPRSLAFAADGRLYATSLGSGDLTIIDPASNQVAKILPLPVGSTFAVVPSPDGGKVYLTARDDNLLVVVDARADSLLTTIPVGLDPRGLAFAPDGSQVFVSAALDAEIAVVDTRANTLVARYQTGRGPRGIAVLPAPAAVPTNHAPLLLVRGPRTGPSGTPLTLVLEGRDPDGDALAWSVEGAPAGAVLADGIFTWTPTDQQSGVFAVTFTAADGRGATASQTVELTIDSPSLVPTGDFDGDGRVDFDDFFLFVEAFGGSEARFDLDESGRVGLEDFFVLVEAFNPAARAKLVALAHEQIDLPADPRLDANFPNPFNGQTVLRFTLPYRAPVQLALYNLAGQPVARLLEGTVEAGVHTVPWDGRQQASGLYLAALRTPGRQSVRKILLLR